MWLFGRYFVIIKYDFRPSDGPGSINSGFLQGPSKVLKYSLLHNHYVKELLAKC